MAKNDKAVSDMTRQERIDELLVLDGHSNREADGSPSVDCFGGTLSIGFDGNITRRHMELFQSFIAEHEFKEIRPTVPREELRLRLLLAQAIGHPMMYMDDGEMQDNSELPGIDYLRDSADLIREKLAKRALLKHEQEKK